jgi:AAA domain
MRFRSVSAIRFGPLVDRELRFDAQFTIVHGRNEAAKSTWHAAILAGFCGMRRGRGKPRAEDASFETRHAPWNSDRWSVQLSCVTDAGQPLELTHDLRARTATVVDTHTGEDLAGSVMFDGAPDGSALIGVDRKTFRSTAWVRQADVAAVRDDPAALQALMQAVADSSETSVGDALSRIDAYRQTHVGSDRVGSTRPLRSASEAVTDAQRLLGKARESQTELHRLQANLGFCESRIGAAQTALDQLQGAGRAFEYEQARARLAELTRRSESFPEPPVDVEDNEALYARVQEALRSWAETAPASELPRQSDDDFRQLRDLRDAAHERQQMALTMSSRFRPLTSDGSLRTAGPGTWFRRSLGLLAMFAGAAGFVYPAAWVLAAVAGALLLALRSSATSDTDDAVDREQLREILLRSGIDEPSLSDGYLLFEQREDRFQIEQNAKISVLERQLDDQRRSGVVVAQQQAQRFVASDALSAAVVAVGAAPLDAVDDEVAFLRRWSGVYEIERGQDEQMRRDWQVLQLELQQTPLAELRSQVDSLQPDALQVVSARPVKQKEIDAAQRELRRYRESRAELSGRLEAFTQRQSVGDAEVSLAAAQRRLEATQSLDFALSQTGEILKAAQLATYRTLAPRLQQRVGEMLASVTNGRYSRVAINPEDLSVRVEAETGIWKDATQLSHGTGETVYLLLRIVLAEELADADDESCPLVLDDTLVHLDSERKLALLQLLQVLSDDRQVILFSQEDTVRLWAEQNLPSSQLVLLSTDF